MYTYIYIYVSRHVEEIVYNTEGIDIGIESLGLYDRLGATSPQRPSTSSRRCEPRRQTPPAVDGNPYFLCTYKHRYHTYTYIHLYKTI